MKPKEIISERLKERYFYVKHPSGLRVYLYPKPGYRSSYAILGVDYGSINSKFRIKGSQNAIEVPDGIAHYLEHKLFEGKDANAFELYAKTGASANAYTSFDKTAYLFSCSDNFKESLEILLDFVQSPYFTEENVEKERGIIRQEIEMYKDNPDWRVFFNLLGAMYHRHPVRLDVAGSVESISRINPENLYQCYKAFYNLNNASLCVVGDIDVNDTFATIDKHVKYSEPFETEKIFPDEPLSVLKESVYQSFDVACPTFQLGFKEKAGSARVSGKRSAYTDIILKAMASKASPLYRELLDLGIINVASFSSEYMEGPGFASVIFSGESNNPEKAAEKIRAQADEIRKNGIDRETFERAKKSAYGENVASFNSVSSIANVLLDFSFAGIEIFDYIEAIANAELDAVNDRLNEQLDSEHSSLSVVRPNE